MNEAIDAIDFYQQYYKRELLLTLTITMGGWVYLLIQQLYLKTQRLRQRTSSRQKIVIIVTIISILGIILFNYGKYPSPVLPSKNLQHLLQFKTLQQW